MWPHFVNLSVEAWHSVLIALSTSTLAIILFSLASPVVTFFITLGVVSKLNPERNIVEHLKQSVTPTLIGFAVPLVLLACVFGWKIVETVYNDHQLLVARANAPKPSCPTCTICPTCPKHSGEKSVSSARGPNERKRLREALGQFVQRGMAIRDRIAMNEPIDKLQIEGQSWANEVVDYLRNNFDSSYEQQFKLTHPELSPAIVPPDKLPLWHGLNERIQTLDKFIDQLK
jgi:hypothetical protein